MSFDRAKQIFDVTYAEDTGPRLEAVEFLWEHGQLWPELALPRECRELAPSAQQAYLASGLTPLLWETLRIGNVSPYRMNQFKAEIHRVYPDLPCRPVPREALEHIPQLPELRYLSVRHDELTDEDVDRLAPLGALEHLILHSNRLTDACLPHICRLRSLRSLDLGNSRQLSVRAVERAASSLPDLMTLTVPGSKRKLRGPG